ncbi:unnamed protein product [Prorocentrum cordatum]|uniref:Uncharacterized protein n=1 Tax=Prorocentrum cordatum TaxID=2364126 RepID=A0ABN9X2G4_9DINO|nr:unnamed protein product [Polarella glacialis]
MAAQTEIGEVVQHGIDNSIMMKVKIETPTKRTKPKEPHFEEGDKENIENLNNSHEFDGKQQELGGIVARAEGVWQDSKLQDKLDGGDNIEDGAKLLVGGAETPFARSGRPSSRSRRTQ